MLPGLIISVSRILLTGWLSAYIIQVVAILPLVLMFFFRNKIATSLKVHLLSLCIFVLSFSDLFHIGISTGVYLSCFVMVLIPLLMDRVWVWVYGLILVGTLFVAGLLFATGIIVPNVDLNDYNRNILSWLESIMCVGLFIMAKVFVFDKLYSYYDDKITTLQSQNTWNKREKQQYEQSLYTLPVAACLIDLDGRILFLNKKFTDTFGYNSTHLPDLTAWSEKAFPDELVRRKNMSLWKEDVRNALAGGEICTARNYSIMTLSGLQRSAEVSFCVVHDTIAITLTDNTDALRVDKLLRMQMAKLQENNLILEQLNKALMQNEAELKIKNENLDRANQQLNDLNNDLLVAKQKAEENEKLKNSFLQNMSHEIRTPMNAIVGFTSLLKKSNLTTDASSNYINIIENSSEQLLKIVNDVLDISKIEAGMIEIFKTRFRVNEMLKKILTQHIDAATLKNLELSLVKPGTSSDHSLYSDQTKLRQVIDSMVVNALKFTSTGYVHFGYTVGTDHIAFFVEDTGIGIDPKDQEHVFERFSQGDNGAARRWGGTGLGLSIAKAYVGLLGGTITLESYPGKGSRFEVIIPTEEEASKSLQDNGVTAQPILQDSNIQVVIVEDEEVNLMYYDEIFCDTMIDIRYFKEGIPAIEYIRSSPDIDLVIMDIKLPDISGYEAVRQIKEFNSSIPVIVVTAYTFNADQLKSASVGCDFYFSKPVKRVEILNKIAELVKKHGD
jgi:signal transduction histidine kinase/CheY-like chemotaxis protein